MKKDERLKVMAEAFKELAAQKEIQPKEMQGYIEEVLVRVFSKDENFDPENEEMELGDVTAKFDIETGEFKIQRR
jgi:hypothetical protein